LQASSHHNILGEFRLQDLGAWLDRYCAANPQTKLPLALSTTFRRSTHPTRGAVGDSARGSVVRIAADALFRELLRRASEEQEP
jgi:hypothetical protein